MSNHRFTVSPDHNSMLPEDFSAKVTAVSNDYLGGVIGDSSMLSQLERAYIRLDPVSSAFPENPQLLAGAFSRAAEITESIAQTRGHAQRQKAAGLAGTLLLDKVSMDLESVSRQDRTLDLVDSLAVLQKSQRLFRDSINWLGANKYQHTDIVSVMGSLSARAMRIRIGDEQLHTIPTARRRVEVIAMQKSALSGIILDSMQHMREIHTELFNLPETRRSNHKGHLTEFFAFSHNVMQWREFGVGVYSVRFALQREDHAGLQHSPRRTFDIMERRGLMNQPVEVKSGATSYDYHEEIAHWRPNHPRELEQQYEEVIDSFGHAISGSSYEERQDAQQRLAYHFKQP